MDKKFVACIGNFVGSNSGKVCGQIERCEDAMERKPDRVEIKRMKAEFYLKIGRKQPWDAIFMQSV